jgi:hypothetical protein
MLLRIDDIVSGMSSKGGGGGGGRAPEDADTPDGGGPE